MRLVCSSGFYVRTLAHDLGQRLGCGAHLEGLRRTRAGDFTLDDAATLEALATEGPAAAERRLIPMERLLPHLRSVVVNEIGAKRVSHGSALRPGDIADERAGTSDERAAEATVEAAGRLGMLSRNGRTAP